MQGSLPQHRTRPIFDSNESTWNPRPSRLSRRQLQRFLSIIVIVVFLLATFAFFRPTGSTTNDPKPPPQQLSSQPSQPPSPEDPAPPREDGQGRSEYYEWDTVSFFKPPSQDVRGKTVHELCKAFPQHMLESIQPVLKLGHGDLKNPVLRAQMHSVSACLDDLLIFSDLEEEVPGNRTAYDVLEDLPPSYLAHPDFGNYTYMKELQRTGTLDTNKEATASINGWILDKYKFLPMIERAWAMRPHCAWYVFYETDTYIFWDNMFRFLDNFDPDTPQYMGSPSPGRLVPGTEEPVWFANGGPGFVLSRAAMQKLMARRVGSDGDFLEPPVSHRWIDLLNIDCCGDSVMGWALFNAGIKISGFWPMFNPHPAHGVPFGDAYWCQPVLTLHKTKSEDVLGLWRWEQAHRQHGKPILYRDLYDFQRPGVSEERFDWENGDWGVIDDALSEGEEISSFDACRSACERQPNCFQYDFYDGHCRLINSIRHGAHRDKDQGPDGGPGASYTSGWLTERIGQWRQSHVCDAVQWVRPSVKRIF